jgi:glycosyltransferase involved in cell wall biosynthesis
MNKQKCITLFTKNRPEILSKTLPQLTNADLSVIVLDDSTNTETKRIVDNIAKKWNNIYYHGRPEQKELLQKFTKLVSDLDYFIKPLGTNGWTLGYVRNYAIILAKTLDFERVLFMDDDIIIKDVNIIKEMMKLLDNADFVGAKISGMPDDSVVGYIMRELGMKPYEFLSGGFLAFNLDSVSECFLNYYNEDWIWLFLHKPKVKLVKYGEVHQLPFNPFENAVERALQQEFGEILVDGVKKAIESKNNAALTDVPFWNRIVEKRSYLIKDLINLS